MGDLRVPADPALHRARAVLAVVALATLASAAIALKFGEGEATRWVPLVLIATVGPGLWFIARGHGWARWTLSAGFLALGLLCTAIGLVLLFFDFTTSQEPLSIIQTWMVIVVALLFITAAAVLFVSDALDELCGGRRFLSGPGEWDAVSAPEPTAILPTIRVLPDQAQLWFLQRWGTAGGWVSTVAAAMAWIVFLVVAVWLWRKGLQDLEATKPTGSLLDPLRALAYPSTAVGYVSKLIAAFLALFVAALFAVLPVALPLALRWKHPARFLILRPFNRSHISRALRRILSRDVAPLGHCYTLADADIRVALWLRLPLLLGQLSFFVFRQRKIAAPKDIPKLVRAMDRRVLRNFNWCVSRDKIFPIGCVDAGWRACVTRLVAECDGVVMDLSGMSENILWELELLNRTRALERTLFLVEAEQYDAAKTALNPLLGPAGAASQLIGYSGGELLGGVSLTAATKKALHRVVAIFP